MSECYAVVYDTFIVDKELRLVLPDEAIGARVRCFHNSPTIAAEIVNSFAKQTGRHAKIKLVKATLAFEELEVKRHQKLLDTAAAREPYKPPPRS